MKLLEKIQQLVEKITESWSKEKVISWQEEATRHLIVLSLKDNKGIQIILERFFKEYKDINSFLLNADSKTLSTEERDRLLDKKQLYKDFLSIFSGAEQSLIAIEKLVDEELS